MTGADVGALGGVNIPVTQPAPVLATDQFGRAGAAIKTTVEYYATGALPQLPSGNAARTLAAWVKCAAPASAQGPTVLELGDAGGSPQRQSFSVRAGGVQTPSTLVQPLYNCSTVAGAPPPLTTALSVDGTGTNANFLNIVGLSLGAVTGRLFVGERTGQRVRVVNASTGVVTTLAGSGNGFKDAQGTNALFGTITDVVVDPTETFLLVCDLGNHRIRKVDIASGNVTTLFGGGAAGFLDGIGTSALMNSPGGLAVDAYANGTINKVYFTEQVGNRVRMIDWNSKNVTTIGGQTGVVAGQAGMVLNTGSGMGNITSLYSLPKGLTLTPDKSALLVHEQTNNQMRRINLSTLQDSVFVGSASLASSAIGAAVGGCFGCGTGSFWYGAFDAAGHLFATENAASRIVKIAPSGAMVGVVLASGAADGYGASCAVSGPSGIAVDSAGIVYFGEYGGNHVRRLTPPAQHAVTATAPACDSTWHHVAASLDGRGGASVFVDGVRLSTTSNLWANTNNESPPQLRVGGGQGAAEAFSGSISDVRIYNTSLSAAQVLALALPPPACLRLFGHVACGRRARRGRV